MKFSVMRFDGKSQIQFATIDEHSGRDGVVSTKNGKIDASLLPTDSIQFKIIEQAKSAINYYTREETQQFLALKEDAITKSTGYLTWNGTMWVWKNETYSLSTHNHDGVYLTAITKEMVEGVLTGAITSHTHSYLPLAGGTLTGSITGTTFNFAGSGNNYITRTGPNPAYLTFRAIGDASAAKSHGNGLGLIAFTAWNGANYAETARIYGLAVGDQSASNAGGALYFYTTEQDTTTLGAAMYISHDKHLIPYVNNTSQLGTSTRIWKLIQVGQIYNNVAVDNLTASHYLYESGTDKIIRRKTLANAQAELVTKAVIEGVLTGDISSHTHSAYQPLDADLTAIAALPTPNTGVLLKDSVDGSWRLSSSLNEFTDLIEDTTDSGFLTYNYLSGAFSVDTNTYLTAITKAMVEGVLTGAITSHTHSAYQPIDADLTAIANLTGTYGLLKKTAENTWTIDTSTYLTTITKEMVEGVLTGELTSHTHAYLPLSGGALTGNLSSTGIGAFDTLRLASGKYIGYSAAVGTAPTGGLRFGTANQATFSNALSCTSEMLVNRTALQSRIYLARMNISAGAVVSGNIIGSLNFYPYNGTTFAISAYIQGTATENQSATAMGSKIEFATTSNTTTTNVIRWYIDQDGHIKPYANNAYDLATAALRIRQAHVTDYYNYKAVDNETASHYLYETGSDSIIRRKTIANVRTELLQNSPDANLATSSQRGLMSASDALILEQNDLVENLVTADNGLAHKMRNFSGGALAKGDVVMIAPSGTAVKEAGDSSNYFSLWSMSGVTKSNSDLGKLYYTAVSLWNPGSSEHENVELKFFKDSAGTQLVASYYNYSGMSPGAYSITISEENSSGVSGSVTLTLPSGTRLNYSFLTSRYVAPPTPYDVILATADTTESIGVVYSAAPNDLDEVLVATTGIAYVRFKSGVTPLAGDWAFVSNTEGDADRATSPSTTFSTWLKNIGKVLETGTSGGLAKVRLGA